MAHLWLGSAIWKTLPHTYVAFAGFSPKKIPAWVQDLFFSFFKPPQHNRMILSARSWTMIFSVSENTGKKTAETLSVLSEGLHSADVCAVSVCVESEADNVRQ